MANIDEHVVPVAALFASCVFHPDVQMRQKTALGGWEVLRPHCPHCYPPAGPNYATLMNFGHIRGAFSPMVPIVHGC
jgi:hypothetical protein